MKTIVLGILSLMVSSAFASGPFGEIALKDLNGIDQKGCVAGKVLQQEFLKNNVNVVDGKAQYIWNCKGVTSRTAQAKRCPYPQDVSDIGSMKCYSNSSSGGPIVCVAGPSSETIDVKYGDSKKTKEVQPRFKELVVMSDGTKGDRIDRSIKMDAAGCEVKEVKGWDDIGQMNNGSTKTSFEKCSNLFATALAGDSTSCKKGSDSGSEKRMSAYWSEVKELNHCFVDIPNFLARYKASQADQKESKDSKKAAAASDR